MGRRKRLPHKGLENGGDIGFGAIGYSGGEDVFHGIQGPVNDGERGVVKARALLLRTEEEGFELMGQIFGGLETDSATGALQRVGAPQDLFERTRASLDRHPRKRLGEDANPLNVFCLLGRKDLEQVAVEIAQSRYLSTVLRSCCESTARFWAARSDCLVPVAVSWLAMPILRKASVTCSKPICCWLLPPTIC